MTIKNMCFFFLTTLFLSSELFAFLTELIPEGTYVHHSKSRVIDKKSNVWHAIKKEGSGLPVKVRKYRGKNVFWFETLGQYTPKDRSEIRVRNSLVYFDKWYYARMKFFIALGTDKVVLKKDWHLMLQCAQIYKPSKATPVKSPPINLQYRDGKLVVRTLQEYEKWHSGKIRSYEDLVVGDLPQGVWHEVSMRFKLGENGGFVIGLNDEKVQSRYRPIGYPDHDNPFIKGKQDTCSLRFGIYKNGESSKPSRFLFEYFKLSDDYITH